MAKTSKEILNDYYRRTERYTRDVEPKTRSSSLGSLAERIASDLGYSKSQSSSILNYPLRSRIAIELDEYRDSDKIDTTVRRTDAREVFEIKKEKGTAKKVLGKEEFKPLKTIGNALLSGALNLVRTTLYPVTEKEEYSVASTGMTRTQVEERARKDYDKNIQIALEKTKGTPLYGLVKLQEKLQGGASDALYGTDIQQSVRASIDASKLKADEQMDAFLKRQEEAATKRSGIETGGVATRIIGGAAQSLPASVSTRIPYLGWAMMFNTSFQNELENELAKLKSEGRKTWTDEEKSNVMIKATASAALEIGTEMIFPLYNKVFKTPIKGAVKGVAKEVTEASLANATKGLADLVVKTGKELIEPTVKNVSLEILKQMAEEGSEEGINYVLSAIVAKLTTDKDKKFWDWTLKQNPEAIATLGGLLESMATGSLMAGGTGAVRAVPKAIKHNRYKKFTETIKEFEGIKDKPIDEVDSVDAEKIATAFEKDMDNPENAEFIIEDMFEALEKAKTEQEGETPSEQTGAIPSFEEIMSEIKGTPIKPKTESTETVEPTMPVKAPTSPVEPVREESKVVRPSGRTVSFSKPVETVARDMETAPKGNTINSSYAVRKRVDTVATVLPYDSVIPSMDADSNLYDEYDKSLQPRDAERVNSAGLIEDVASKPDFPNLFRKETIGEGIPVVDQRGMVVAGNHRIAGILKMMRDYPQNYEAYKQYARDHASELGLTPEQLQGDFIVTRVLPKGVNAQEIARLTNIPTVRGMSPTEIARQDSRRMTDEMLAKFVGREDGLINTKDNHAFIQDFATEVIAPSELNQYTNKDGDLNADGVKRIVNAIFHRAYGDTALLDRVAESTDNDIKRITTSMINVAPMLVEIQEGIKKNNYYDIDLAPLIKNGAEEWIRMKESGDDVQIYAVQSQIGDTPEIIRMKNILFAMDVNKGSAKRMTELYSTLIGAVKDAGAPNQVTLFGDVLVTIDNVINAAKKIYNLDELAEEVRAKIEKEGKGNVAETAKQSEDRKLPRKETPAKKETPRKVKSKQAEAKVEPKTETSTQLETAQQSQGEIDLSKAEIISSKTSMGNIYKISNKIYKPTSRKGGKTTREAEIYKLFKGSEVIGNAEIVNINGRDYLEMPEYDYVVSIDDVNKSDRHKFVTPILDNIDRILLAVQEITNAGYDYGDPLQFGFDIKSGNMYLIDFSNAEKYNKQDDLTRDTLSDNYNRIERFLKEFGIEKQAKIISDSIEIKEKIEYLRDTDADDVKSRFTDAVLGDYNNLVREMVESRPDTDPNNVYYSTNARPVEIGNIMQSDMYDGTKYIYTDKPLTNKQVNDWELKRIYESKQAEVKADYQKTREEYLSTHPRVERKAKLLTKIEEEVNKIGKEVLIDNNIMKEGQTIEQFASDISGQKSKWQGSRKIQGTAIQLLSTKNLWGENVEPLRKALLAYAQGERKGFLESNEILPSYQHKEIVKKAIKDGKIVPKEVLADYPELTKPKAPVQEKAVPKVETKAKELTNRAVKEFGRTQKYNEAGYILPSGIMLDFSEKSDGGEPNVRTRDHREVSQFYKGKGQTESMNQFIKDTGAIRIGVSDDVAFVDLIKDQPLTQQQLYHIGRALSLKPRVTIDVYESADKNVPIISEYMENPLNKDISKFIEDAYANEKLGEKETESYEKIVAKASEAQDDTGKLGIVSDAYLRQQRIADVPKDTKKERLIDYDGVADENVRHQFDNSKRPVTPEKTPMIISLKNFIRDNFLRASVPEVGFEHGQVRTNIIKLRKRFSITSTLTFEEIKAIYHPIGSRYKKAMDYAVILPDLVQDIELGKYNNQPLPFGFETIQQVIDENARLKKLVNDPMDSTVKEALKRRSAIFKANQARVIRMAKKINVDFAGYFTRADYVHHAILEYVQNTMNNPKLKNSAMNILRSREGGQKAYITDATIADFLALQKLKEIYMKLRVLKDIKDLDISRKLPKDENGNPIIPKGYEEADSTLIHFTFPEEMLKIQAVNTVNAFIEKFGLDSKDPAVKSLLEEANKTARNVKFIIPSNVKEAYANALKARNVDSKVEPFDKVYRKIMSTWKTYQLMSPRRAFTYQLRNTVSDFSKTLGFMPKSIEYVPKAVSMLTKFKMDKGTSEMLLMYIEAGGLEGGLTNIEMGDYKSLDKLDVYDSKGNLKPLPEIFKAISKPMNGLENFYQWREQIFRFAGFLYFYEKGLDQKTNQPIDGNYRASKRAEIQSIKERADIAYKMSNDIVGAYDDTTPFTNFISRRLHPFFRFQETNNKAYLRGLINTFYSKPEIVQMVGKNTASKFAQGAKITALTAMRLGKFVILASLVDLVLDVWNKFFRKEEDEQVPSYAREQSHITLGKLGDKVYYLSNVGSLREALEWIGFSDPYNDFRDLATGKKTYEEKIKEIILAPVKMSTESIAPLLVPIFEYQTGKKLFSGQYIRDKEEYLSELVQLKPAYRALTGKAQIDGKFQWNPISFQKVFENETYFWDIYTLRDRYLTSIGKHPPSSAEPSKEERSKALYEFRTSIRYKDKKAALKYLSEYIAYGGDLKGINASANAINPLQRMNETDRKNFVDSLYGKDKEVYEKGMAYYEQYKADMVKFYNDNKAEAERLAKEVEAK